MAEAKEGVAWESASWAKLSSHADVMKLCHLRDLVADGDRTSKLKASFDGILLDYARELVTDETMALLVELAGDVDLQGKIAAMAAGAHLNTTEDRAVSHMALRAPKVRAPQSPRQFLLWCGMMQSLDRLAVD